MKHEAGYVAVDARNTRLAAEIKINFRETRPAET